jgi:hypothetical protein
MKTKDLIYSHFDLFQDVMNANENSENVFVCPSCEFSLVHKSHTLSVESVINKVIGHILETHK